MRHTALLSWLFWLLAVAAPFLVCLIAIAQFPPGVEVPLHWGASGQIDGWGSPWAMLPFSLIMCAANALMWVMYRYSDKMYDMGLVHGVSRKNTRPFLCATAVVMVLITVAIFAWWVVNAKAAM